MSDIDTVAVDSLKALDPKRPIREADIRSRCNICRNGPIVLQKSAAPRPIAQNGQY
ncbi:MAG: hypothetical protein ABSF85_17505 [Terriglobales bacterium]